MFGTIRKFAIAVLAVVALFVAVLLIQANVSAAPPTCTISTPTTIAFSTTLNVYTSPQAIVPVTYSGTCDHKSVALTLTFLNGIHNTGSKRAMLCTGSPTSCGTFTTDILQYNICSDAACATPIANGGTVAVTSNAAGPPSAWSVTVYAQVISSVAGTGPNDSAIGSYTDSVTVSVSP